MFKPCPNCGFLVALIAGREASQRCPRCGSGLVEPVPTEGSTAVGDAGTPPLHAAPEPGPATAPRAAPSGASGARTRPAQARDADADASPSPPAPGDDVATAASRPEPGAPAAAAPPQAPSFIARGRRARRPAGRRWPWAVVLPLLALLLGLQLLLSQRVELAQDARWRPLLVAGCGVLGCEVPAWREPAAFAMLARDVRPHPARAGLLHVTTSLRNDARWPQPLPVILLRLSDLEGRPLAARAVAPADYGRAAAALVAPGQTVDIAFDVREPSPRVVSFDFQLR